MRWSEDSRFYAFKRELGSMRAADARSIIDRCRQIRMEAYEDIQENERIMDLCNSIENKTLKKPSADCYIIKYTHQPSSKGE